MEADARPVSEVPVTLDGMKALASKRRFALLGALKDRRKTVSELADELEVAKGTLHRHLDRLVEAGFVARHEDERMWVYYELTDEGAALAAADRPRIVVMLGAGIACLLGTVALWIRAATLSPLGDPGGGAGAPGPGPGPVPTPGFWGQPEPWWVLGLLVLAVGVALVWNARRAVRKRAAGAA